MAKLVYKPYAQNEIALFPLTLDEMVPSNHKARVVNAVIDRLDISAIEGRYKGGGTNVVYMWLSGTNWPDFRTINEFRSKRL